MSLPNTSLHSPAPVASSASSSSKKAPNTTRGSHSSGQEQQQHPKEQEQEEGGGVGNHHDDDNSEHLTSSPPFKPFFTIIEGENGSEYQHPTAVHYIFSDDDTDIVTDMALQSIVQDGQTQSADSAKENYIVVDLEQHEDNNIPDTTTKSVLSSTPDAITAAAPPPQFIVKSSQSLSSTWQVLNTKLVPAPTFDNVWSDESNGLMLKIQGTSGLPPIVVDKDKDKGSQRLEQMMGQFSKRMTELARVIEAGERFGWQHDENRPERTDPYPAGDRL